MNIQNDLDIDIVIINGPNLNLIGTREISIYGNMDINILNNRLLNIAFENNIKLDIFQSNSESDIINKIQSLKNLNCKYIIANFAAYSHTSIAIRDVILAINIPTIEVHISNLYKREDFRHKSYISDIADGIIIGFGLDVYIMALNQSIKKIKEKEI
jgi:3-dehydroquinate dehydratase-2